VIDRNLKFAAPSRPSSRDLVAKLEKTPDQVRGGAKSLFVIAGEQRERGNPEFSQPAW